MQPPGEKISGMRYSLGQINHHSPLDRPDLCPGKKQKKKKLNNKQAAGKKKTQSKEGGEP
jgi:hypothetical protein